MSLRSNHTLHLFNVILRGKENTRLFWGIGTSDESQGYHELAETMSRTGVLERKAYGKRVPGIAGGDKREGRLYLGPM